MNFLLYVLSELYIITGPLTGDLLAIFHIGHASILSPGSSQLNANRECDSILQCMTTCDTPSCHFDMRPIEPFSSVHLRVELHQRLYVQSDDVEFIPEEFVPLSGLGNSISCHNHALPRPRTCTVYVRSRCLTWDSCRKKGATAFDLTHALHDLYLIFVAHGTPYDFLPNVDRGAANSLPRRPSEL